MNKRYVDATLAALSEGDPTGASFEHGVLAALVRTLREDPGAVEAMQAIQGRHVHGMAGDPERMRDALCDYLQKED